MITLSAKTINNVYTCVCVCVYIYTVVPFHQNIMYYTYNDNFHCVKVNFRCAWCEMYFII